MNISLSDDAAKQSVASIRRYFKDELDQDIGDLKAALVLEFFIKEIAPSVYNDAISDAQAFLRDRVADLEGVCSVPEFAFWDVQSIKRKR
ncbi:MAG: DUF2164 domain-containing protein [Thermoanaerobaculia bacterium]